MLGRMTERLVLLGRLVRLFWIWWQIYTTQTIIFMLTISLSAQSFSSCWEQGESLPLGQQDHARATHMNNWKGLCCGNGERWHGSRQGNKEWQLWSERTKKMFISWLPFILHQRYQHGLQMMTLVPIHIPSEMSDVVSRRVKVLGFQEDLKVRNCQVL